MLTVDEQFDAIVAPVAKMSPLREPDPEEGTPSKEAPVESAPAEEKPSEDK